MWSLWICLSITSSFNGKYKNWKINFVRNGGKEIIADSIKSNIESEFEDQFRKVITLNKNIERWNDYYEQRDFDGIRRETNNIQRNIKSLFPIETTIKEARKIENLYKIIERKGGDFNLSEEEISLAKRLVY